MLTLLVIFGLMPVFVFIGLTAQRWLCKNGAEKIDMEKELYQQLLKSARVRSSDALFEQMRRHFSSLEWGAAAPNCTTRSVPQRPLLMWRVSTKPRPTCAR